MGRRRGLMIGGRLLVLFCLLFAVSCQTARASSDDETIGRSRLNHLMGRKHVKRRTIVVDAGHGGEDFGTHSLSRPRYHEKYLTLATALMARDHLRKLGYQVVMTRGKDRFIALDKRVALATSRNADAFVSIHFNSAPNTKAHGIEIFYYASKSQRQRSADSKRLAQNALSHIMRATHARDRGIKSGNFAVIRDTKMPAILVEGGFMTNSDEVALLKDPKYLNKIAWGIAKGVDQFMR